MHSLDFLIGRTVERISPEDGLTLHLDGGSGHVSGAFALKDAAGCVHEAPVGPQPVAHDAYSALVHHAITDATADNGTLRLRFDDGSEITAFPENHVEAWEVSAGKNF